MTTFDRTPRPKSSKWGQVDGATELAPGIWEVHTPGHGGIVLSLQRWNAMPHYMPRTTRYSEGGQFEEDCDWCLPVLAFADELDQSLVAAAAQNATHEHLNVVAEWFWTRFCDPR